MLLPSNCPYAEGETMPEDGLDTIACCRVQISVGGRVSYARPPLCRCQAEEVYDFSWASSFDGAATVLITRQGKEIMLRWEYQWFVPDEGPCRLPLTMDDWNRLEDALDAAGFWSLDQYDDRTGFDGSWWTVAGRRGDTFHAVSLWSPEQEGLRNLGRLFFRLAGPPLATVPLY